MTAARYSRLYGTGYPLGLSGGGIPLCARIMAIADVFDALISKRCYKESMPLDEAFGIIGESAGTHFDVAFFGKKRVRRGHKTVHRNLAVGVHAASFLFFKRLYRIRPAARWTPCHSTAYFKFIPAYRTKRRKVFHDGVQGYAGLYFSAGAVRKKVRFRSQE